MARHLRLLVPAGGGHQDAHALRDGRRSGSQQASLPLQLRAAGARAIPRELAHLPDGPADQRVEVPGGVERDGCGVGRVSCGVCVRLCE